MALVRSKNERENVAEICAEKDQLESSSQRNKCLTVSNVWLRSANWLPIRHGNHAVTQD